jgi:hypothetical protein
MSVEFDLAAPVRRSASNVLGADLAVLGGAPAVVVCQASMLVGTGVALVQFSCSGRGGPAGVPTWQNVMLSLLIDGVFKVPSQIAGYVPGAALTALSGSLVYRATGLVAGNHTFALWAQLVEAVPYSYQIYPVTRPNQDHASLVVTELDA